jgi:cyanophycin synthetase
MIAIYDEEQYIPLLWTHLIPATLEGKARHNVANALAAAAIAYARGVQVENIRQGLRTFSTNFYQSPGRLNIFDEHPFRVIVDYGHNPAALDAMYELTSRLRPSHQRIIGVLSMPGDRRDADIRQAGAIAGRMFDIFIIKEDNDKRGRPDGAAAELLHAGAETVRTPEQQIITVLDEQQAVRTALQYGQPNDLLVIFADNITAVWKEVIYYNKGAVNAPDS